MQYVAAYAIGFTLAFVPGVISPGPALTDVILLGGSHLCGLALAVTVWILVETAQIARRSSEG
jgi:hypothetical protein